MWLHPNVYSVWLHISLHPLLVNSITADTWNTLGARNDAAFHPLVTVCVKLAFTLAAYALIFRLLITIIIGTWITLDAENYDVWIQYLQLVWLHICLHYFCCITIIAGPWNTLDVEIDAVSNNGTNLSASNTCIQFCCMYACIHCSFYMIINRTGNTFYIGNNAASNTCKLYGWIHIFFAVCNKFWLIY